MELTISLPDDVDDALLDGLAELVGAAGGALAPPAGPTGPPGAPPVPGLEPVPPAPAMAPGPAAVPPGLTPGQSLSQRGARSLRPPGL